jgi:hypothetical protein
VHFPLETVWKQQPGAAVADAWDSLTGSTDHPGPRRAGAANLPRIITFGSISLCASLTPQSAFLFHELMSLNLTPRRAARTRHLLNAGKLPIALTGQGERLYARSARILTFAKSVPAVAAPSELIGHLLAPFSGFRNLSFPKTHRAPLPELA